MILGSNNQCNLRLLKVISSIRNILKTFRRSSRYRRLVRCPKHLIAINKVMKIIMNILLSLIRLISFILQLKKIIYKRNTMLSSMQFKIDNSNIRPDYKTYMNRILTCLNVSNSNNLKKIYKLMLPKMKLSMMISRSL